jgi:hypothetical protein
MSVLFYEILKFVGLLAGFGLLVFLLANLVAWLSGNGGEGQNGKDDRNNKMNRGDGKK